MRTIEEEEKDMLPTTIEVKQNSALHIFIFTLNINELPAFKRIYIVDVFS